jgi:tetratricopeptide (TPR) repeat protein
MPIKRQYILFLFAAFFALLFASCTQYKNKFINRKYHDVTLRYNVYFYARESLKEGIQTLEDNYKDDYTELLPVFKYGDKETSKAIFPQMDRAIKKSSEGIQRHAIKDKKSKVEIPNTGRWVDDCWNTIGKAHFYKREYFSAIESFEYVESAYKGKQKEEAKLWLMKSYNELNALSQSDHYASLIKNDKKFPDEYKGHYHALYAEFYIKQGIGQYDEAIKQLTEAIKKTKKKSIRARYHFILGQLYEERNKREQAMFNYRMVVRLKPPTYELSFYAKVKQALMNKDPESIERARQELYKMTKDFKNSDLLDVIFYTLGQIDENQKNIDNAYENYTLSVKNSISNNKQKAKSYLKLADLSFEKENYVSSSHFYDSTIALIKEDYPGYQDIKAKKTSLDSLVKNIVIIKTQDSLQGVANLDTITRTKLIKQIIQNLIKHEQDSISKKQQALSAGVGTPLSPNQAFTPQAQSNSTGPGDWYFYNTLLKAQGLNDFIKRWGANRKSEDNWRRSNKTSFTFDEVSAADKKDSAKGKDSLVLKSNDKHEVAYYLKNLPLTKADQDSSNKKILEAYYALGTIYREMLNNSKKSAQSFETMNQRFPGNKYEAPSYYQLYRIFVQQKNDPKATEAKNFLLAHYPKSDYAKIIHDPDFAKSVNAKQSEVDDEYVKAYNAYTTKNYSEAYLICSDAVIKYGKGKLTPKFAYLRALSSGYLYGIDSLERNMATVVIKYQKTEVYDMAKATLDAIKKQKQTYTAADTITDKDLPVTTFKVNDKAPHYFMVIMNNAKDIETIKNKISDLNKEYFSTNNYEITSLPKDEKTMITVRTFKDRDDAIGYYNFILTKPNLFTGVDKNSYSLIAITTDNVGALLKTGNFDEYKAFFEAKYLGIKQ